MHAVHPLFSHQKLAIPLHFPPRVNGMVWRYYIGKYHDAANGAGG